MVLTEEQKIRYSRTILLPEVKENGQEKLLAAKVLIVGLGGLGSAVTLYLASSGIGTLYLSDNEIVELSNLQRQILYSADDVGKLKTTAARQRLLALNPPLNIMTLSGLSLANQTQEFNNALQQADVIVDCSDNFATRFALNKFCVQYKKPLVSGSAIGWQGQVTAFNLDTPQQPCYACLYPEQDALNDQQPSCAEAGVIAPLVGVIASQQALAVIRVLLDKPVKNILWRYDGLKNEWSHSIINIDVDCIVCACKA